MSKLSEIFARHGKYQDAMVSAFTEHLHAIVLQAQASVTGALQKKLSIKEGVIENTPGNARTLRQVGKLLQKALDAHGYQRLVSAFTTEFPGQLPFLNEIVDWLGEQTVTPFPPINFTAQNLNVLGAVASNATTSLMAVMDNAASVAMTRGLFSIGGLQFSDLIETIADKLNNSIPQATTVADTSMSVFMRTATDERFKAMTRDQPGFVMRYKYAGPDDKVTRPFCHAVLAATRKEAFTREDIDGLDNGQLPNVWITGGGWNCRHIWLVDISAFATSALKKAA